MAVGDPGVDGATGVGADPGGGGPAGSAGQSGQSVGVASTPSSLMIQWILV